MAHHVRHVCVFIALFALSVLSGCMTMTGARPLYPGKHQVGVTLGGAMVNFGAPVPLPNATIEGRSGLVFLNKRPLELNYGVNVTALGLGIVQGHVGASWLLLGQRGKIPALALTNRVFVASNFASTDADKAPGSTGIWGADQIELVASYMLGRQLVYVALAEYLDFGAPDLLLTPAVGAEFDVGSDGGFKLGVEARYFAVNKRHEVNSVDWFPGNRGALGLGFGVSYAFGEGCAKCRAK